MSTSFYLYSAFAFSPFTLLPLWSLIFDLPVLIKSLCLWIIWIPAILYELRPDSSIMHEAAALAPVLRNAKRMSFKWLARCQREMESKFSKYQPTSQQKFTSV